MPLRTQLPHDYVVPSQAVPFTSRVDGRVTFGLRRETRAVLTIDNPHTFLASCTCLHPRFQNGSRDTEVGSGPDDLFSAPEIDCACGPLAVFRLLSLAKLPRACSYWPWAKAPGF